MLNFTLQRQNTTDLLTRALQHLLEGSEPDTTLLDSLPQDLRALLAVLTKRLTDIDVGQRRLAATIGSLSTECRDAGRQLASIGETQEHQGGGDTERVAETGTVIAARTRAGPPLHLVQ